MQTKVFLLRCAPNAWHKPMVVVDFPSPKGVGLIPKMDKKICVCVCMSGNDAWGGKGSQRYTETHMIYLTYQ